MKRIIDLIEAEARRAFKEAGYGEAYGRVNISNRPDLCQYQCNDAMAAAKVFRKPPMAIAKGVTEFLKGSGTFKKAEAAAPGFINLTLSPEFLAEYVDGMRKSGKSGKYGIEPPKRKEKIIVDYGGPNVAKPLHVGHLRAAIIGESIKRIARYAGHDVIGDVHLGDWGLQIGLIITELEKRCPDLPYFDEDYEGEYPSEPPFTMSELEEIYPRASAYSKEDPEYLARAQQATAELQKGRRGYIALWKHIIDVSIPDIKKNYDRLDVSFDLWKKESDVQGYIPDMVAMMKEKGYAHESDGAIVVDVGEEGDAKEMPPCILVKSNGASNYETTDLATIIERVREYKADRIIYVADKRQSLHFEQVFRCAKKTGIAGDGTKLVFVGFGTMNGKDGKPFKTRDGGVLRLESLISEIDGAVYERIIENRQVSEDEARKIAEKVGLSALKYGDLSNQASKDYVFDIDRFISFEGNTGPYILYVIVRIKSVLAKYEEAGGDIGRDRKMLPSDGKSETDVYLCLSKFSDCVMSAYNDNAPHKICQYVYELSNAFNSFYHENKILAEEDADRRESYIALLLMVKGVLEQCIDLLGFSAPDRM